MTSGAGTTYHCNLWLLARIVVSDFPLNFLAMTLGGHGSNGIPVSSMLYIHSGCP